MSNLDIAIRVAIFCAAVTLGITVLRALRSRRRDRWDDKTPLEEPVTFLNLGMALRPKILGHVPSPAYQSACKFFGVGLIDRTGTLDPGFAVDVLCPIPSDWQNVDPIDTLCADRAAALVGEARERGVGISLLWSGGIDSTCAAVSLLTALGEDHHLLDVVYTEESVAEYPLFFDLMKERGIRLEKVRSPSDALTATKLNVTGEHGDQIFGSMLAEDLDADDYRKPWRAPISQLMARTLDGDETQRILDFLEPQTAASPIPVETAFDWLWWANFSMKWQAVSLRMLVPLAPEARVRIQPMVRHFFGTDDFQRWSLANPDKKIDQTWASYKWPLKDIVFAFTDDAIYRHSKVKERSLRLVPSSNPVRNKAVALTAAGALLVQPIAWSQMKGSWGVEGDFGE